MCEKAQPAWSVLMLFPDEQKATSRLGQIDPGSVS